MSFNSLWSYFTPSSEPDLLGTSPYTTFEEDGVDEEIFVIDSSETDFVFPRHLSRSGDRLKELYFSRDENRDFEEILEIPDYFSRFTSLVRLDLRGHKLVLENDNVLFELRALKHLDLAQCRLKHVPDAISKLELLESLDLEGNSISQLPEGIFAISTLLVLTLSTNNLSTISNSLNNLSQLQRLDLSRNKLSAFPGIISTNMKLKKLLLWDNEITSLPESISSLTSLVHFDISQNHLLSLPESIGDFPQLSLLNCSSNSITYLPETITKLSLKRQWLIVDHNPLQKPPLEECMKGIDTIRGYFQALNTFSGYHSNRTKVIILGESLAGKTSLCQALINGKAGIIDVKTRTEGIDLYQWRVRPEVDNLEAFVVDCAGQKKYIMTHKFFISQGSLFLVVVDIYHYEMTIDWYRRTVGNWIDLTLAHVPDAVIVIVPTHMDLFKTKDDKKALLHCQHVMKNIWEDDNARNIAIQMTNNDGHDHSDENHDLYTFQLLSANKSGSHISNSFVFASEEINFSKSPSDSIRMVPISSLGRLEGISELRKEIIKIMTNTKIMPLVGRKIPTVYVNLEEHCVTLRAISPVMKSEEFITMTESRYGMNREMTISALRYMDTTGTLLYFSFYEGLDKFVFLDPKWLVKVLKKLFCYKIEEKLKFKPKYIHSYHITSEDFEQLKEDLIENARLSSTLLRCVWSDIDEIVNQEDIFQSLIDILSHFQLVIKLGSNEDVLGSPILKLLVPWFFKTAEIDELSKHWPPKKENKMEEIACQFDSIVSPIPVGSFERFIANSYNMFNDVIAWENAFLGIQPDCTILCTASNSDRCGRLLLKGRCQKENLEELWKTILLVVKIIQDFFNCLPGLGYIKCRSLCPSCISKELPNPHMFTVPNWFAWDNVKTHIPCPKEHKMILRDLLLPPKHVIIAVSMETSGTDDENPLSMIQDGKIDLIMLDELSEMVGVRHKTLGRCLGLSHYKIETVCFDNQNKVTEQTMGMLSAWIEKVGHPATIHKLYNCIARMKPTPTDLLEFLSNWRPT